jgi:hypothetical protein
MTYLPGEDRSSFQGVTGWGGDVFGFAKATEGEDWSDPTFRSNWANLRAEGKVRGAYHFFHPASSPAGQAQFFITTVREQGGIEPGDVFIVDAEITVGGGMEDYGTEMASERTHCGLWGDAPRGLTAESVGPAVLEFLQATARLAGPQCRVMLYSDASMSSQQLSACSGYPLFLAYYAAAPVVPAPWRNWTFWQNGARGPGRGDQDYFNGDEAALRAWASPGPVPLPPNWAYPPVRKLVASGGDTSFRLEWDAPAPVPGQAPMPGIAGYEITVAPGLALAGTPVASYPRRVAKGTNPEVWQGGSLARKTQYTAGVRAYATGGGHSGPWATATFSTT